MNGFEWQFLTGFTLTVVFVNCEPTVCNTCIAFFSIFIFFSSHAVPLESPCCHSKNIYRPNNLSSLCYLHKLHRTGNSIKNWEWRVGAALLWVSCHSDSVIWRDKAGLSYDLHLGTHHPLTVILQAVPPMRTLGLSSEHERNKQKPAARRCSVAHTDNVKTCCVIEIIAKGEDILLVSGLLLIGERSCSMLGHSLWWRD